jgi:uncharacterized protein with HEPN domain
MHREEITDNLEIINESVRLVRTRFKKIEKADDFSTSLEGSILLDAISMRLQVIGESVKRIQKIDPAFFQAYQEVDWTKIAKFRDFVSHHYENIDHEIVYDICKAHIPQLIIVVNHILHDLKSA